MLYILTSVLSSEFLHRRLRAVKGALQLAAEYLTSILWMNNQYSIAASSINKRNLQLCISISTLYVYTCAVNIEQCNCISTSRYNVLLRLLVVRLLQIF
jgi:hypothetical protein